MGVFEFLLGANIAFLLLILYLIFHGWMFQLWRFQLAMAAFMSIVAFVTIGSGESQKWLWLPGIWILGFAIPYVAGLAVLVYLHIRNRGKKTTIYRGYI